MARAVKTRAGSHKPVARAKEKVSAKKTERPVQNSEETPSAVSPEEVADFTREFSARIDSGVSLVRMFTDMAQQQRNEHFKSIIEEINNALQKGSPLSSAMARYPEVFDKPYIDAIRMGEVNGNVDRMLHGLVESYEMLSFDEAVKFLGTSTPTLYRLLKQGDVKGLKVGRQWRFRTPDLVAYMERRPTGIASAPLKDLEAEIEYFAGELQKLGLEAPAIQSIKSVDADESAPPDEQKVHQLINSIFMFALHTRSSDIHFDPQRDHVLVRLRNDGVLQELHRLPSSLLQPIVDRLKVMADMNVEEKRIPQDGRIHIYHKAQEKEFDMRVAVCPSSFGESVVMRILDPSNVMISLDQLGLQEQDLARLREWLHSPNGMVLVTGPTGSGKTTVLYSCLNEINFPDRKIVTVEDPIEWIIPGAIQVRVARKVGLTFASAVRAFMRQDPDIIMAGEIRDRETAEIAAQAALSGHLLLSTMHVNSAAEAVLRLRDMGLEPFIIAACLTGISAQRLARRICNNCKEEFVAAHQLPAAVRKLARDGGYPVPQGAQFYRGRGCETCRQTGYRGRIPLYELMSWSEPLTTAFIGGASREELTYLAIEGGMKTMLADGVRKAAQGETTIEEVQRVLGVAV